MKNLQIQIQYDCPFCNATGELETHLAAEYHKKIEEGKIEKEDENAKRVFFSSYGTHWQSESQKIPCYRCYTKGVIEIWVPIEELGQLIQMLSVKAG